MSTSDKIYENAIDSICLGIEDYKTEDPKRVLSATRNLVAGILLLFKHKLAEISPAGSNEILIKERSEPKHINGSIVWVGKGDKTIGTDQILGRCDSLGIRVDGKRIKAIVNYRNEIEHYYTERPNESCKRLISDSFIIVRDFFRDVLHLDPREELGEEVWATMVGINEVHDKERKGCERALNEVDWDSELLLNSILGWSCPSCGSDLISIKKAENDRHDIVFVCNVCKKEVDFETAVESAVEDNASTENYIARKDGGDPITTQCPFCYKDTYSIEDNRCLICDESAERECSWCGNMIPWEELSDDSLCSWCRHMSEKDD